MAEAGKTSKGATKLKNPMAEAANWNARCITEEEAPHKWNEAWGQMFSGGIPHEYPERIAYLENELKNCPPVKPLPKYGLGSPFKEPGRKKKVKYNNGAITYTNEELDAYNASNGRHVRD